MKINNLTYEILKNCIEIYLFNAYPDGYSKNCFNAELIDKVKAQKNVKDLLECFKVEKLENGKIKYSLQLGSFKYPFIKIALISDDNEEYGFLVDRHTEYMKALSNSDFFEKELEIKSYTKVLKSKIEDDWERNNIPTYREIVRKQTEKEKKKQRDLIINKLGYKILLVEDDTDIGKLHKIKMELMGYDVVYAENGETALNYLENQKFDLMVLDLMMPSISGFEIIKKVSSKIPIIVLSAISDKMTIETCLNDGAKAFIVKPASNEVLEETLQKVIKQKN